MQIVSAVQKLKTQNIKLTYRRHRIRPLHKRIVLHASSLLLLLGGGFIPLPFQQAGQTATLTVSAKVPAPIPSAPAIITSPVDQQHLTSADIIITGTCPDQTYVIVYRGTAALGTSPCTSLTFSVHATLVPGANVLSARDFNITDDPGPTSPAITVFYDIPTSAPVIPPAQPTPPTVVPAGGVAPLTITTPPYHYQTRAVNEVWQWAITLAGGVAPYTITINWGDGQTDTFIRQDMTAFIISHAYAKAGTYLPLVRVQDKQGTVTTLQLLAIVLAPLATTNFLQNLLPGVDAWKDWLAYAIIVGVISVFWAFELLALHRHITHRKRTKRSHA